MSSLAARLTREAGPARRATLIRDVLAGLTVAFVLIPQALAYATVAGMPEITGLYAAALPPLAAAFFASSPYLQTGPVAQTSLLTFGALAGRAAVGSDEYVQLGVLLALVVGVVRVLIGLLRTGFVAHLMSEPMLMGFVPAGAILILSSQVPAALGAPSANQGVLQDAASAAARPGGWDLAAVALGLVTLAIVFGGRRLHRLFPGALLAVVVGLVCGAILGFGGSTVGEIPAGLPPFTLDLPWEEVPALLLPGTVIALVGFAEPASIARTYAARERQAWNADREFVSQGVANLASGVSGGYPIGGSFSRSSLNHAAGAVTRASGAVTGIVVLAFLPFAAVLEPLPRAVLGTIVISAVLGLLRFRPLFALWRVSRPQFAVAWVTFGSTLLLAPHIEQAVLIGIALSIAIHLLRELRLQVAATVSEGTLELRPSGVLWFGNADSLGERLTDLLAAHPDARRVRLVLDGLGRIDISGAMKLRDIVDEWREAGVDVELCRIPVQSEALLRRAERHRARLR